MKRLIKGALALACFSLAAASAGAAIPALTADSVAVEPAKVEASGVSEADLFSNDDSPVSDYLLHGVSHFGREKLKQELSASRRVVLTFDDGPHPKTTPKILEILKRRNIKAVFFVLGLQAKKYPELVAQIHADGHIIGNHTYNHKNLNQLSEAEIIAQIEDTNDLIEKITGTRPVFCRPPYGAAGKDVLNTLKKLGMCSVLWTIDPKDWQVKNETLILNSVKKQLGIANGHCRGGAVLMHDIYVPTVRALEPVLDMISANDYSFTCVDSLNSPKDTMWASLAPDLIKTSNFPGNFNVNVSNNKVLVNMLEKKDTTRDYSAMELLKASKQGKLFSYLVLR